MRCSAAQVDHQFVRMFGQPLRELCVPDGPRVAVDGVTRMTIVACVLATETDQLHVGNRDKILLLDLIDFLLFGGGLIGGGSPLGTPVG